MELSLSNHMGHPGGVQSLNIKCINDLFMLPISYNGGNLEMTGKAGVGLKTNKIFFNIDNYHGKVYDVHSKAVSVFEKFSLTLNFRCNNKSCNFKYFICSSSLKCINNTYNQMSIQQPMFEIAPYDLYMESFVYNEMWIQNLWSDNITCIYSVEKYDDPPIEVPLIDWSGMNYNKIVNKIATLITFS